VSIKVYRPPSNVRLTYRYRKSCGEAFLLLSLLLFRSKIKFQKG
jgi:hypothetical protein